MAHMMEHNHMFVNSVNMLSLMSSVLADVTKVVSLISSFTQDQSPLISSFPKVSAEFFTSSSKILPVSQWIQADHMKLY